MSKHITTSELFNGFIAWDFNSDNFLVSLEINAELSVRQYLWLSKDFPMTLDDLLALQANSKLVVKEVPEDLSFNRFWDAFSHKVGNKAKIEKQWNAMPDIDKIAALAAVPRYLRYLTVTSYAQAMASTWLEQRRWENEYSTKPKNKT